MNALRRISPRYAVPVVLALMVVAVYGRVGSFPFIVLDDEAYILRNPALQGGLSAEGLRHAFTTGEDAGWIPLTWVSRMLDVSLFGMDAGKHHLVNVLFHLLNAALLFSVLLRMTGRPWESALASALFAVHPLHVESVAWVTERKDVLAGFFWMLSLSAYVRYVARPGPARYGAMALFFVLGLLSKPIVVTLPFVLLLLDYWPLGRTAPASRLVLEKVPLLVLSASASAVTYLAQRGVGAVSSLGAIPLWARAGNALLSYAAYLRKGVWPSDLAVYYPHPGTALPGWKVASAGLFLCLATALVVRHASRRRWLATGWFWYLGALVPVIGLVHVGGVAMADRNAYLPMIGIYVVVAWGSAELSERLRVPVPARAAAAGAGLLALAAVAWVQAGYWSGTGPLFRRALEVTRENWMAHSSLGEVAQEAGRFEAAAAHFREVLRIWPEFADAHNNLGVVLLKLGRPAEAIPHFREALRLRPDIAEAHNNLGVLLSAAGRDGEARDHFREALRLRPGYPEAHYNLGMALSRQGTLGEATFHLREAVRLRPDHAEARNNLGVLLARQGAFREAESEFREALRLDPGHEGASRNLEFAARDAARSNSRSATPRKYPPRGDDFQTRTLPDKMKKTSGPDPARDVLRGATP